jgi:hypothetical protein
MTAVALRLAPALDARAEARVAGAGWSNVSLIHGSADDAEIAGQVDAVVIFRVHDVMRSPSALRNLLAAARPGARVLIVGVKWAAWWALPLSVLVWVLTRSVTTTREGFRQPWDLVRAYVPNLEVRSVTLGTQYIAIGTTPA